MAKKAKKRNAFYIHAGLALLRYSGWDAGDLQQCELLAVVNDLPEYKGTASPQRNFSNTLANLKAAGFLQRNENGTWSLTHEGQVVASQEDAVAKALVSYCNSLRSVKSFLDRARDDRKIVLQNGLDNLLIAANAAHGEISALST